MNRSKKLTVSYSEGWSKMKRLLMALTLVLACSLSLRAETIRLVTSVNENTDAFHYGYLVVQEIGRRMGATITLTTIPAKRTLIALEDGDKYHGDIARSITVEKHVAGIIRVKEPIVQIPYMAVTRLDLKIIDKDSLKPYRVVFRSDTLLLKTKLRQSVKSFHELKTPEQLFKFVLAGRADIIIETPVVFTHALESPAFADKGFVVLQPPIFLDPNYTYFNEKYSGIANRYEAKLIEMKGDGTYDRILAPMGKSPVE